MPDQLVTLPALARSCGASVDQLRHWAEKMGCQPGKVGRARAVPAHVARQLEVVAGLVAAGVAPSAAVAQVEAATPPAATGGQSPEPGAGQDLERAIIAVAEGQRSGLEAIRAAVAGLVETNARQAATLEAQGERIATLAAAVEAGQQEVASLRQLVGSMASASVSQAREFAAVRAAIAQPTHVANLASFAAPPAPVRAWSPPPARPDPLAGASWIRRAWVRAFEPHRLRRRDS